MRVIGLGFVEFVPAWSSSKDEQIGTIADLTELLESILMEERDRDCSDELPTAAVVPVMKRKEFKQLFCRQNYPKCASDAQYPSDLVVTPCRTSCQAFAKRCPGANAQCNDFSQDGNCQDYKYMTERAYMTAHAWTGATMRSE